MTYQSFPTRAMFDPLKDLYFVKALCHLCDYWVGARIQGEALRQALSYMSLQELGTEILNATGHNHARPCFDDVEDEEDYQ